MVRGSNETKPTDVDAHGILLHRINASTFLIKRLPERGNSLIYNPTSGIAYVFMVVGRGSSDTSKVSGRSEETAYRGVLTLPLKYILIGVHMVEGIEDGKAERGSESDRADGRTRRRTCSCIPRNLVRD